MKPIPEIIKVFNWVDIFFIILSLRIIYIAFKNGLKSEFFKILGTLSALYLSLHYYSTISDFVGERFFNRRTPSHPLDVFSFALLVFLGYGIFFLLRAAISRFMDSEINPSLDKWGGVTVGVLRSVLLTSVILCLLLAASTVYLNKSVRSSFSGSYLVRVAPKVYQSVWTGVVSKLDRKSTFNVSALELIKF